MHVPNAYRILYCKLTDLFSRAERCVKKVKVQNTHYILHVSDVKIKCHRIIYIFVDKWTPFPQ